jgi:RES domain-containing protein
LTVWRLTRRRYAALDGEGARRLGGRWNSPGHGVVYTSSSLALAILEVIVHLELAIDEIPADYVGLAVSVPDALTMMRCDLPQETLGDQTATVRYGDDWLATGEAVGLWVPSFVVPLEWNLLLNPDHREFIRMMVADIQPFHFDPRLFR